MSAECEDLHKVEVTQNRFIDLKSGWNVPIFLYGFEGPVHFFLSDRAKCKFERVSGEIDHEADLRCQIEQGHAEVRFLIVSVEPKMVSRGLKGLLFFANPS